MPFISAELNKALKMKLDSTNSLQSLIRGFTGNGTTNIFNQFNQQNNIQQEQGISIEEARKIILESQKIQDKTEEAKLLEAKYDLSSLPEVVATKQEGVDVSKEGLNINKQELAQITDDYKGALEASSREHHELRREIEMRVDPDEEDPELIPYEEIDEEEDDTPFTARFLSK